tara:strand:- start:1262 stop:1633 length:372 start_codon:yes stop_codon:yes gene_type:complete
MELNLPTINGDTPDKLVAALARMALHNLDQWVAEVDRALVGRQVVRTRGALEGAVCTITGVCIANGASGYHLFLTAPIAAKVRESWSHSRAELWEADRTLLELGVTCELLAEDDTPTEGDDHE